WQQVAYTPKQSLALKRFAGYWGTKTASPTLTIFFIPEQSAMLAALKANRIDIGYPDDAILPAIRHDANFQTKYIASRRIFQVFLNDGHRMANPRVRQAFVLSIDAKQVAKQVFLGYGSESSEIPSQYSWAPR